MSGSGILARVPGEYVAKASDLLPKASTDGPKVMFAEIDAPYVGRVRIRFEVFSHKHRKHHSVFWVAHHAEAVPADSVGK